MQSTKDDVGMVLVEPDTEKDVAIIDVLKRLDKELQKRTTRRRLIALTKLGDNRGQKMRAHGLNTRHTELRLTPF